MRFLIIAGEASGDIHGGSLINAIKAIQKGAEFYGIGGRKMKDAGAHLFFDIDQMGIIGAVEVFGKLSFLKKVYDTLLSHIYSGRFDAIILIDYPTLNMKLAKAAKSKGLKVFYYISPQVWAWREKRVKDIQRDVDRMITILPFEKGFYKERGLEVDFVGHPFVDIVTASMDKDRMLELNNIKKGEMVIGIMPGSRKNEIDSLFSIMLKSARIIKNRYKDAEFLVPVAETVDRTYVEKIIKKSGIDIKIATGTSYDVMNISDALIMASGSATLEASFFAVPMVIVYKVNMLTYLIGRLAVKIKNIGLVNIVAGETIAPELIQGAATPENISSELINIIEDKERYNYIKKRLKETCASLGDSGACARGARIIIDSLN